jgi:hypothetical protein
MRQAIKQCAIGHVKLRSSQQTQVYLRVKLPICALMQYAYTQKYIEHEKTKEKFAFFFPVSKDLGILFSLQRKKKQ